MEHLQDNAHSHVVKAYKDNQEANRRVIVKAAELMSNPVIAVNDTETIENAWYLMKKEQIKHLPVMQRGELIGICTETNILARVILNKEGELEGVKSESVADVMNPSVVTTSSGTEVRHVAQALMGFEIDALVVMDDYQQIQGIITRSDLISRLAMSPPIELYT